MMTPSDCVEIGIITILKINGEETEYPVGNQHDVERLVCFNCNQKMRIQTVPGCPNIIASCGNKECTEIRERNQYKIWLSNRAEKRELIKHDNQSLGKFDVPESHIECSFDSFVGHKKYIDTCKTFIKDPHNRTLLITGDTGSGKTHLAIATLKAFREKGIASLKFEKASMMFFKLRNTYGDGVKFETELDLIQDYSNKCVLIIDDLGTEQITENSIKFFQTLIDNRVSSVNRYTIITTNLDLEKIEGTYGSRVASRLGSSTGLIIKNTAGDYRVKEQVKNASKNALDKKYGIEKVNSGV